LGTQLCELLAVLRGCLLELQHCIAVRGGCFQIGLKLGTDMRRISLRERLPLHCELLLKGSLLS
jgi:hypothetical protein